MEGSERVRGVKTRDGEEEEDLRDDLSGLPLARVEEEVVRGTAGRMWDGVWTTTGDAVDGKGTEEVPRSSSSSELSANLNMAGGGLQQPSYL